MSKAEVGMKLVRWLPQIAEATADDIARFGPQAARVRALLDFLPTMSDEAVRSTRINYSSPEVKQALQEVDNALWSSGDPRRALAAEKAGTVGTDLGSAASWWQTAMPDVAAEAAIAESVADIVSPEVYRTLTNPLAAGRAVDLLRTRPRYQGTPFLDIVRQVAERGAITGPRDVVAAGRIARSPEDIREIAITLMSDGMSAEEAMRTARML